MQQDSNASSLRLLRLPEVLKKTGLAKSTVWRDVARGSFPRPAHVGKVAVFAEHEIDSWIAARLAERGFDDSAREAHAA
jgi:prophage regulatory protein